jgi:integrase/recombinase XerD
MDKYLHDRVGGALVSELNGQAPPFVTRNGKRIQRWDIYRIAQRICDQANAQGDEIRLTLHMLRHMFLKRVADKHGIQIAQNMSRNISMGEVFRYTKPSQEEKDKLPEKIF